MMRKLCLAVLVFAWVAPGFAAASSDPRPLAPIPPTYQLVNDLHGTLTIAQRLALTEKLSRLENQNGTQIVLLIVPNTAPESVEEYALRVVRAWDLGHHGESTGVLFAINGADGRFFIATGGAVQGALPDGLIHLIITEHIEPHWRQQQWFEGIDAGIDALITATQMEITKPPVWMLHARLTARGWGLLVVVLIGLTYAGYYSYKHFRKRSHGG